MRSGGLGGAVAVLAVLAAGGCSPKTTSTDGSAGAIGAAGTTGAAGTGGTTGAGGTTGPASTGAAGNTGAGGTTGAAGNTGAGGTTGAAGTAGTTGAAGATGAAGTGTGDSVTTRNNRETRDGFYLQPTITKANAATFALDAAFNQAAIFDGATFGSPLFMENGPAGKGAFFVATVKNLVYAIDEETGRTVWMHSIGPPPPPGPCNNVGIISTPVLDVASRTIFVAGATAGATATTHEIHALSVDTGQERPGWPVVVSNLIGLNGTTPMQFNAVAQNQRGALSLVGGVLYVPYGAHKGDCGNYRGWIVAVDIADPKKVASWVAAGLQSGVWAAGGMASDGDGVFATTGDNRWSQPVEHEDSQEVVHVTGMAKVDRATGIFFPSHWRTMDQDDADFASSSPVIVGVGGTRYVGAVAKDAHFYLLRPKDLGGMGGQVAEYIVSNLGGPIRTVPAAYVSATGTHVVMGSPGPVCPAGQSGGTVSLLIAPGSPPKISVAWCASTSTTTPIATSTNGKDETIVWTHGLGLEAFDGDTGARLLTNGGGCAGVERWTSPIAVKGRLVAAGDGRLCSWSAH